MLLNSKTTVDFLTRISAKLIYGTIVLMTVLGSLNYYALPRNITVIVTAFLSLLAVTLAATYAQAINEQMIHHHVTPWGDIWRVFRKQIWVMGSTPVPVIFFALAALGIITQDAAFRMTENALLLVLLCFGFVSCRSMGGSMSQAFSIGLGAALLGLMVVEMKLWAKYLPEIGY